VKISDAYNKAIAESREINPLVEKRKNQLAELLQQIDVRIKEVNKNASIVEERIYQVLQEALLQLQEETQKKMSYLIGD
jgi:succinyl-CoA synthetase beta subunit